MKVAVDRDFLVRVDSLLSCLKHRHGKTLDDIGELDEVSLLAAQVRDYTEGDKNTTVRTVKLKTSLSTGLYYYALRLTTSYIDEFGNIEVTLRLSDHDYSRLLKAITNEDEDPHDKDEMRLFMESLGL